MVIYERTETLPELRRKVQHLELALHTAQQQSAEWQARAERWQRSAEAAWQFARLAIKTGRMPVLKDAHGPDHR